MKSQIPDELKKDLPENFWGKVLGFTPVVMAVVATLLAGLASSEMTQAQYDRSLAAQQQAKAGDQWGFFQAKRLRSALQRNSSELLQDLVLVPRFDAATFKQQVAQCPASGDAEMKKQELLKILETPIAQEALSTLSKGDDASGPAAPLGDPAIKAALEALDSDQGNNEHEMAPLLAQVSDAAVHDAVNAAKHQSRVDDAASKPISKCLDQIGQLLPLAVMAVGANATEPEVIANKSAMNLVRSFTMAHLTQTAKRYDRESRLNQVIANLYELQIRKSNLSAERHHQRSQRFFLGMLGAQLGVIIATLAMAAKKRNLLWSLAAGAGSIAVIFAAYVYFCL